MAASDFIAKYGDAADAVSKETGIPAERILGQAGLETGWNSAPPGNNFFGIKGPGLNLATHEADASGALVPTTQSFRAYADPTDSFRDYGRLIQNGYKGALDPSLDDAGFAKAIKAGGYATDPGYAAKLHGSIQLARQHHKGGWETVGDAAPIGAGAGFGDGRDDKGWETVATAAPPADTDTPAPPQAGAAPGDYSLGGLAQNAGTDLGNIWEGMKGVGKRAVDDVGGVFSGKPQQALQDVGSIAQAINPLFATIKSIKQGVGIAKDVVNDPTQVAKDAADFVYKKPVTTAMNAAALAFPGAGGAGGVALKGATTAVRGVDAVVAPTLGRVLTGVPGDLQREASAAGLAGGERAAQLRGQLRGTADRDAPVRIAEDAADSIQGQGLADRNATVAGGPVGPNQNPAAGIQQALTDARAGNRDVAGIVQSKSTEEMLDALQGHMDTSFPGGTPRSAEVTSVEGMDALKRRIGDELASRGLFNEGGQAGRLGGKVYNSVKQAITDAYPAYAPGMERAENAITGMQQMRRQLSLNGRNDATTAGALQRAARNDANGAYGMRKDQLAQLVAQKPELLSAIAGQALSAGHPRGITPVIAAAAHGVASPITALLQYAAGIPRLHGEARYLLGAAVRRTGKAGLSQANIGRILDIARIVGSQQNQ